MHVRKALLAVFVFCLPVAAYPWGSTTHFYLGQAFGMQRLCNWPDFVDPYAYSGAALWAHELRVRSDLCDTATAGLPFAHILYKLADSKVAFSISGHGVTTFAEVNITARGFALHSLQDTPVHYELFPFQWNSESTELHKLREAFCDIITFYEGILGPRLSCYQPPPVYLGGEGYNDLL